MSFRFGTWLLDLLFPPRCVFCQTLLKQGETGFCSRCQTELPWITGQAAEQKPEFISLCASPLWFQGEVRESIHRYKFSDRSCYAATYARLMAQCVSDHLADRFDLISWVPLSAKSLKKRGYDQAELLAKGIAQELGEGALCTLRKVRNTRVQSGLTEDAERRANVLGAYEITEIAQIEGKRILLVDDVITTGSTLSECARMLRTYGAADVVCVTLARARGKTSGEKGRKSKFRDAISGK